MNKLITILATVAFAAFFLGERCIAQQEAVVHTVDFPKGDAAWSVTFEADQLPGQPAGPKEVQKQRAKVDIVRKGDLRHDLLTWSDKTTTDFWWSANPAFVLYQDYQKGSDGRILVMKTGNMGDSRYDETFFSWISAAHYGGLKSFKGKSCRYYAMSITLPDGEQALLRGWIENKTSIPVGWSESAILSIFSFDVPLPPDPLVMPPKFQAALNRMQSFFVFPKRTTSVGP